MLNAKAYALSVRDDTSFRVEGGSGGNSEGNGYTIAKVTVNMPLAVEYYDVYGPLIITDSDDGQTYLVGADNLAIESTILDVVLLGENIATTLRFSAAIDHCSGGATVTDTYRAIITGDGEITLSDER